MGMNTNANLGVNPFGMPPGAWRLGSSVDVRSERIRREQDRRSGRRRCDGVVDDGQRVWRVIRCAAGSLVAFFPAGTNLAPQHGPCWCGSRGRVSQWREEAGRGHGLVGSVSLPSSWKGPS